jgi:hypothetical protein
MASKREKELEAIVRKLLPAVNDIAWCALVWNDHNFTAEDLYRRAKMAGDAMGFKRHDGVDPYNEYIAHVLKVLEEP